MADADLSRSLIEAFNFTTSQARIQNAALEIPKYDGETTSLTNFVRAAKTGAQQLVAGEETRYLLQVLNKLRGAARASVEEKNFTTLDELIEHLKKRYAPGRNLSSFLSEIGRLRIGKTESLRKYINRTTKLYQKARAAQLDKYHNDKERKAELEEHTLENFLYGLPREIRQEVVIKNPKSLDAGFDLVMELERKIKNHKRARNNYDSDSPDDYRKSRRNHSSRRSHKRVSYPNSPSPYDRYHKRHYRDVSSSSSTASSTSESSDDERANHHRTYGMHVRRYRSSSASTDTSRSRDRNGEKTPERRKQ
ncbi:uncharacterized protein LOC107265437 [Cephus cinctus]|uniref:Uncharacterized protein LOC107265437 n=1 Tax=Cephus cinctus TaxID=211228 RepID=A0AAJ7BNI4_CEPCN|nr:uncharacterized protein LOC107265437 [Cephus cinctus]